MKNDLPTPEELGEKLKRGEITKEEAIEVMSERARREAFANLYGPPPGKGDAGNQPETPGNAPRGPWRKATTWLVVAALLVLLLYILLTARG